MIILALVGCPVSICSLGVDSALVGTGLIYLPPGWIALFAVPIILLTAAWLFLRQADHQPEKFRIGMGILASPALLIIPILLFYVFDIVTFVYVEAR